MAKKQNKADDIGPRAVDIVRENMGIWKGIVPDWFLHGDGELGRMSLIHSNGLFLIILDSDSSFQFLVINSEDIRKAPPIDLIEEYSLKEWDKEELTGLMIETLGLMLEGEGTGIHLHTAWGGCEGMILSVAPSIDCEQFMKYAKQEYVVNSL